MSKPKRPEPVTARMLPPLQHLTLDDWARICERADQRYEAVPKVTLAIGDNDSGDSDR